MTPARNPIIRVLCGTNVTEVDRQQKTIFQLVEGADRLTDNFNNHSNLIIMTVID